MNPTRLMPVAASTNAPATDAIYFGLLIVASLIVILVATLIAAFAIRYRRGTKIDRAAIPDLASREIEIGWTLATLLAFIFIFVWAAAQAFLALQPAAANAITMHVVAKQWMWKIEQPGGQREIDALHVPTGRPVRLLMNSEDVIHSFFIPAFRLKKDIVPGHTETLTFEATRPGTYHLFCSEFCGTDHSRMLGAVFALRPQDYAHWLEAQPVGNELAKEGEDLFRQLGCSGCHGPSARVRAPPLAGVYGHPVPLSDGRVIVADEAYIRDSILLPKKDIVAGYEPVMPSFGGRVDEGGLQKLVAYIASLADPGARP